MPALLRRPDYQVRVLDWMLFDPHVFHRLRTHPRFQLHRGDLRDPDAVAFALQDVETVIHLACLSNDPSCYISEDLTRSINYDAGVQLIRLAKRKGVRRFINASSASVYGVKQEQEVDEDLPLEPMTSYAKYKAGLEDVVNSELSSSFSAVTVRPATLCGVAPRQRFDITINTMTYEAVCKGKITLFNAEQTRPNLSVRDMVDVYLLLLTTPVLKIHGETFNVSEENYRVIEIANIVRGTVNGRIEIEQIETNDLRSYRLSGRKIATTLGYVPRFTIRHAIRELATALQSGKFTEPDSSRYRNVAFLRENLDRWSGIVRPTSAFECETS